MAPEPEQIPSRMCGCSDCLIDYPPEHYGHRPPQGGCRGPWRVRYRDADGKRRAKNLRALSDANWFLATVQREADSHAS